MSRWLVVGAKGQLGSDLLAVLSGRDVVGVDLAEIDITDPVSVSAVMADTRPDVVVNAAAYTAVDAAESDEATALAVNGDGPGHLAAALARTRAGRLIHISTDYVFGGDAAAPYAEDAAPAPRSAYGRTKLAGEQAAFQHLRDRTCIVRTAWLYGAHGSNFVTTMLRLEREHETVSVVADQRGQPTWSKDLARQLVALADSRVASGIFHGTNSGACTWFDFAQAIFALAGADPERVLPTTTADYPRPAPRPAYSVLGHDGWARVGLAPMRQWRESLTDALPAILQARGLQGVESA